MTDCVRVTGWSITGSFMGFQYGLHENWGAEGPALNVERRSLRRAAQLTLQLPLGETDCFVLNPDDSGRAPVLLFHNLEALRGDSRRSSSIRCAACQPSRQSCAELLCSVL